jgi:hypothetical protein
MNRPDTVTIAPGETYPFYCEVQQEYEPAHKRLRRYTGTLVKVLRQDRKRDEEAGTGWIVRAWDGCEFSANEEEIDGWDYALDQFFWIDGTYGKGHAHTFLSNERAS